MTLHIYAPPADAGGPAEAPRMGTGTMKHDDVTATCEAYRNGLVPLKAAALALGLFRKQRPKAGPLTANDLIEWTGAKRTQAYEAVQVVNLFLASLPRNTSASPEIPESRNPGFPDAESGNSGQNSPPLINPPIEREKKDQDDAGVRVEPEPEKYPASPQPARDAALALVDALNFNYRDWCIEACRVYPANWVVAIARKHLPGCTKRIKDQVAYMNAILVRWVNEGPDAWADGSGPRRDRREPEPPQMVNFTELYHKQEREKAS